MRFFKSSLPILLFLTVFSVKEFRNVKFYRVVEEGSFMPDQLGYQHPNLRHITYKEFNAQFTPVTI